MLKSDDLSKSVRGAHCALFPFVFMPNYYKHSCYTTELSVSCCWNKKNCAKKKHSAGPNCEMCREIKISRLLCSCREAGASITPELDDTDGLIFNKKDHFGPNLSSRKCISCSDFFRVKVFRRRTECFAVTGRREGGL